VQPDLEHISFLQPEGWPDIVPEFADYLQYDFCWPIKVMEGTSYVGLGAAISFGSTGWLAHIIVDPPYRNRGIGGRITRELLRILHKKGTRSVVLVATEMGYPIYRKAGFREAGGYCYLKKKAEPGFSSPSVQIIPFSKEYESSLLQMDRTATGEDRSLLLKPVLDSSFLFVEESRLAGYYLPGFGEGPVIAENEHAGIELLKVKCHTPERMRIPTENQAGLEFLLAHGYTDSGTKGTRMILGEGCDWNPGMIFGRIGGNYG
jgi:GNAT superfamily N-acetyltransferase